MTTLAVDTARYYGLGTLNDLPIIATDIIYEGAAVGIVKASGHVRPLSAGDKFVGFAEQICDNSTGAAAAKNCRIRKYGEVQLSVSGAVITDVGQPVYASDDDTFVFTPTSNSLIGFVTRYISSGVVMVEFDVDKFVDPYGFRPRETVSDNKTLDAEDSGKLFWVDTDAKVITLPTIEGMTGIVIVNGGAFGTVAVTVSPGANDMVEGPDITAADNKGIINTKATACRGDYIRLEYGDANGWTVSDKKGIWARVA